MTNAHLISALRRRRAEISGHIHDLEKRIARQRANLANLDATIKLFSPGTNPDSIPAKRHYRRTRYFVHNELSRLTQDALRIASGPLTAAEIAGAVMQAKGMPADDVAFKEIVAARALTVLRRLAKRGTVPATRPPAWRSPPRWLAPSPAPLRAGLKPSRARGESLDGVIMKLALG
jgi:hypothetical protein